jgi:hypothetical protein
MPESAIPAYITSLIRHFEDLRDGTHGGSATRKDKEAHFEKAVQLLAPIARQVLIEINRSLLLNTGQLRIPDPWRMVRTRRGRSEPAHREALPAPLSYPRSDNRVSQINPQSLFQLDEKLNPTPVEPSYNGEGATPSRS